MEPVLTDAEFIKLPDSDTRIPIPSPAVLRQIPRYKQSSKTVTKYNTHEKAYDAFCKWIVLPESLRKPKKIYQFELKWDLPKRTTEYFREREDFDQRRMRYFWEWVMDKAPTVVETLYKKATREGNVTAARVYMELLSKKMDQVKPKLPVSSMMIVGIPQEKIDKLFTPKEYENIEDITPKLDE